MKVESTKVKEILVNKTEKTLYEKLLKVREAFKKKFNYEVGRNQVASNGLMVW